MKRLHQNKKTRRDGKASRPRVSAYSQLQHHQAAILEVLTAIANSPHDLQPLFDAILSNATRLCRAKIGTLRLREQQGFRLVSHIGSSSSIPTLLEADLSPFAEIAATKLPAQQRDVQRNPRFLRGDPRIVNAAKAAGIRTSLIVPMLKDEKIIGTIQIARPRVQPFTASQIALVTAFAAEATIALEITRRDREVRELQVELARANRLAAMGQLTASITHEVKQPIGATVTNAQAALRFLDSQSVDLDEIRHIFNDIVRDGERAGVVFDRIRDLTQKTPPRKDRFEINIAIREVIELTRGETVKNCVSVHAQLADDLPLVEGDRVQLQQVVLNLIINAIQAMSGSSKDIRTLYVSTENTESSGVRVAVRDFGPGLSPDNVERLFEPFYSTKPGGMGMGLSISRSIIEAHGGQLTGTANAPHGAVFQFTVPVRRSA